MEHEAYRPGAQVLGDWNIVSCLGAGSYGKVFEIERSEFGQTYRAALKVITVPQSSAEVRSVISEGMSVSQAEAYFHGIVEELMHEFSIMFKLKGTANIVSCEDLRVLEHPDGIGWDILIRMELLHPLLPYVYQHRYLQGAGALSTVQHHPPRHQAGKYLHFGQWRLQARRFRHRAHDRADDLWSVQKGNVPLHGSRGLRLEGIRLQR